MTQDQQDQEDQQDRFAPPTEFPPPVRLDAADLRPETLQALISEYVTRDGTDYGVREADLATKIRQVERLLERGELVLVYDFAAESPNLMHRDFAPKKKHERIA